jgi:hypothetical protein
LSSCTIGGFSKRIQVDEVSMRGDESAGVNVETIKGWKEAGMDSVSTIAKFRDCGKSQESILAEIRTEYPRNTTIVC